MVQVGDQVIAHKTNNGLVAVTQGNQPVAGDKILLSVCMNGSLMTHGVSSVEIGDKVLAIPVGNSPDAVKGGRWGGVNGFWAVKGGTGPEILNRIWFPYLDAPSAQSGWDYVPHIVSYDENLNFISDDDNGPIAQEYISMDDEGSWATGFTRHMVGACNFTVNGTPIFIVSQQGVQESEFSSKFKRTWRWIDPNTFETKSETVTYVTENNHGEPSNFNLFRSNPIGYVYNNQLYLAMEQFPYGSQDSQFDINDSLPGYFSEYDVFDPTTMGKVRDFYFKDENGNMLPNTFKTVSLDNGAITIPGSDDGFAVPESNRVLNNEFITLGSVTFHTNGSISFKYPVYYKYNLDTGLVERHSANSSNFGTNITYTPFMPYVKAFNGKFYTFHTFYNYESGALLNRYVYDWNDVGWVPDPNLGNPSILEYDYLEEFYTLDGSGTLMDFEGETPSSVWYETKDKIWYYSTSNSTPKLLIFDMYTMKVIKTILMSDISDHANSQVACFEIKGNFCMIYQEGSKGGYKIYASVLNPKTYEVLIKDQELSEAESAWNKNTQANYGPFYV